MVGAIETGDAYVDDRETSQHTLLGGLFGALANGGDVLLGDDTALDLIDELEAAPRLERFDVV